MKTITTIIFAMFITFNCHGAGFTPIKNMRLQGNANFNGSSVTNANNFTSTNRVQGASLGIGPNNTVTVIGSRLALNGVPQGGNENPIKDSNGVTSVEANLRVLKDTNGVAQLDWRQSDKTLIRSGASAWTFADTFFTTPFDTFGIFIGGDNLIEGRYLGSRLFSIQNDSYLRFYTTLQLIDPITTNLICTISPTNIHFGTSSFDVDLDGNVRALSVTAGGYFDTNGNPIGGGVFNGDNIRVGTIILTNDGPQSLSVSNVSNQIFVFDEVGALLMVMSEYGYAAPAYQGSLTFEENRLMDNGKDVFVWNSDGDNCVVDLKTNATVNGLLLSPHQTDTDGNIWPVNEASGPGFGGHNYIGGGQSNRCESDWGTVVGGLYNVVEANFASVVGGRSNNASGDMAFIGGGEKNLAADLYSTIPGGDQCLAVGSNTFATGHRAKATNDGSVVFADTTDEDFGSVGPNTFNVRARGGAFFDTDGAGLKVDGATIGGFANPATTNLVMDRHEVVNPSAIRFGHTLLSEVNGEFIVEGYTNSIFDEGFHTNVPEPWLLAEATYDSGNEAVAYGASDQAIYVAITNSQIAALNEGDVVRVQYDIIHLGGDPVTQKVFFAAEDFNTTETPILERVVAGTNRITHYTTVTNTDDVFIGWFLGGDPGPALLLDNVTIDLVYPTTFTIRSP